MDYLKKAPRLETVTYVTAEGEEVPSKVIVMPAIVDSIPAGPNAIRTNTNGTEWRLITVSIFHPKVGLQKRNAQLFEKSLTAFPDIFAKGGEIELQVQTEGKADGYAKAQLPSIERIDTKAFLELINSTADTTVEEVA